MFSLILFIYQLVETIGIRLSSYSNNENNTLDKTFVEMIRMIIRISIILVGIFSTVQILTGKPLTALMAGLGIGGMSVALAAQDTIKNFFGSIMIMTDKPFEIGERVVAKGYDGTIFGYWIQKYLNPYSGGASGCHSPHLRHTLSRQMIKALNLK